jgi:ABC-type phosphate transport system substrate-binding protein
LALRGFIFIVLLAAAAAAEKASYVVIVPATSSITKVNRQFLAEIFFRRATRWSDDSPIRPVDLSPDSAARGRFSQEILARSVYSVKSYWQQRIFSGEGLPPPEMSDDEAAVRYVASHPGSIGYVAAGTSLNGTRAVEVD